MKQKLKKVVSLMLVLSIALSMCLVSSAGEINELKGHWAEETLNEWIQLGLLKGDNHGKYNPDSKITRAEFMALVNRVMNYTAKSDSIRDFIDVSADKWYYNDASIALAAGYIKGTSGNTMSPDEPITREQAITIISRIKGVKQDGDTSVLSLAGDASKISSWAAASIAGAIHAGLVTGSNGNINPSTNATRCEATVLLDRVRTDTRMYYFAGTYGPESGTESANNIIIASSGITLQNITINNNLEISKTVGQGEATLNNVVVRGDLLVNGGGKNSLYFTDVTVEGGIVVRRDDAGIVRIVVSGNSNVNAVILESGAILITQNIAGEGIKEVTIPADFLGNNPVELIGQFNTVTNARANANIILSNASIETLNLNASATINANETSAITTANISKIAGEGTKINIKPETISGEGSQYATIEGMVTPTPTPTKAPPAGGGGTPGGTPGGNTGGDDDDDKPPVTSTANITSINTVTNSVYHNEEYTLPTKVTVNLSTGKTAELAVAWDPDTASTEECGEFTFVGNVTVITGIKNNQGIKASLTLTVEPVLQSIEITNQPANLNYFKGDALDLNGLVVTGNYSDNTTKTESLTIDNISGFDSSTTGEKSITITIGGKTAAFKVNIYDEAVGVLEAVYADILPTIITNIPNGAPKTVSGFKLPKAVTASVYEDVYNKTLLNIEWDIENVNYDPLTKSEQKFTVDGLVQLPQAVTNPNNVPLGVEIEVNVEAAKYTVSFNMNGKPAEDIPSQTIFHDSKATKPEDPVCVSHNFGGWFTDAECTEQFNFEEATITQDTNLYAKWAIKVYKVTYNLNYDGAPEPQVQNVNHGEQAITLEPAPTNGDYVFGGWYTNEACTLKYDFTAKVIKDITLFARWMDSLDEVAEALTFDLIKGKNESEETIKDRLKLPSKFEDYPGVDIEWYSSNPAVLSNSGYVFRPDSDKEDVSVILTAMLDYGQRRITREFNLIVLKQQFDTIRTSNVDNDYFADGYPKAVIVNERIHVQVKLKKTAEVFIIGDNSGSYWQSSVKGVLHGHATKYEWEEADIDRAIQSTFDGYVNIEDINMIASINTGIYMGNRDVWINMVVQDGEYCSENVASIILNEVSSQEPGYNLPKPYFSDAFINDANDKIIIWGYSLLDLSTTPDIEQFSLKNSNGESIGTITDAVIHNVDEGLKGSYRYNSWIELSVENITEFENLRVWYTKADGKLKHESGLATEEFSSYVYRPEVINIKEVAIDPYYGNMYILIPDLKNTEAEDNPYEGVIVKNDGTELSLQYSGYNSTSGGDGKHNAYYYFRIDPITSQNTDISVEYNPTSGRKNMAFDDVTLPVSFTGEVRYVPEFLNEGITAEYTPAKHEIKLTFKENMVIDYYFANCGFILKANNQDYTLRGFNHTVQDNIVTIGLGEHIPVLSGVVSIRYEPHDGRLKELCRRELPDFNEIPVTINNATLEKIEAEYINSYYYLGEELDLRFYSVIGTYSDNTTKEETISLDNVSGYDPMKLGYQTITITIGGETDTFQVYVRYPNYVVKFDLNNQPGHIIPQTSNHQGKIMYPEPTSDSHNFGGWYKNADCTGEPFDFENDIITQNTTFYAKWTVK